MTTWHCSQNVILNMLSFIKHQPLRVISDQTDKFMWLSYKKRQNKDGTTRQTRKWATSMRWRVEIIKEKQLTFDIPGFYGCSSNLLVTLGTETENTTFTTNTSYATINVPGTTMDSWITKSLRQMCPMFTCMIWCCCFNSLVAVLKRFANFYGITDGADSMRPMVQFW